MRSVADGHFGVPAGAPPGSETDGGKSELKCLK